MENLSPQSIVAELDKYVVGQQEAKKAMAIALRNRYRRKKLPVEMQKEITPKNILMIGPTGVGKTEIARRIARIISAPFIKVEATKFTEVGYVGRDVDSIVSDLVEASVNMVHDEKLREVQSKAENMATERIVNYLCQQTAAKGRRTRVQGKKGISASKANLITMPYGSATPEQGIEEASACKASSTLTGAVTEKPLSRKDRERVTSQLLGNQLEDQIIEIEVGPELDSFDSVLEFSAGMTSDEMNDSFRDFMDHYSSVSSRRRSRKVSVRDARKILAREEASKLIDFDSVVDTAVQRAEEMGVVFIDEIDKIIGPSVEMGADVSGEGVQRDLLPIVEGCTVMTRYGPVKTNHMLFISAGAFYSHKPNELIPEIQGRFPLRVELKSLTEEDFRAILTKPENALVKQYAALLSTEGVELEFTDDAVPEIARLAVLMNDRSENIGARRLQTIMERVLEEVSFNAGESSGDKVVVDAGYVTERLDGLIRDEDLAKYIL